MICNHDHGCHPDPMRYHPPVRKTGVQKLALISIVCLIVIIFAGATVRVTGSGLGCPDWPTCWGELIPPTSVEQVDRDKIDIERFRKYDERFGRDSSQTTVESVMSKFDGVQTWIEFLNRLVALPTLLAIFLLMIACCRRPRFRKHGIAAFLITVGNALFGIVVIKSNLHSGVVTVHMALTFALLFLLTYLLWAAGREGEPRPSIKRTTRLQVMVLLACVMIEWALGSQVREMTDDLMMKNGVDSRASWMTQISASWMYLIHRSFSWSILIAALWLGYRTQWQGFVPRLVLTVVGALMLMGLILSTSGIHAVVQVLHVGLAGILVSAVFFWWLAAAPSKKGGSGA